MKRYFSDDFKFRQRPTDEHKWKVTESASLLAAGYGNSWKAGRAGQGAKRAGQGAGPGDCVPRFSAVC